jgi:N-acyl-D-amino-acid deacylase
MKDETPLDGSGNEELLFVGGLVFDGSGDPARVSDVRVARGTILEVGPGLTRRGATTIDLSNRYLAPGFVDVHSHSDLTVLAQPGLESKITQGVTTEVVGNCGSSPFPVSAAHLGELRTYLDSFYPDVSRRFTWDWSDFAGWAKRVDKARPATNLAPLVGHGSLRIAVTGFRNGDLTRDEECELLDHLETDLAHGAFGFSTGLAYSPELETRPEDLEPLLRAVALHEGVYATHQRDEGRGVLESVRESLTSAGRANVRLEISHLKCLGRAQWGGAARLLTEIAAARAAGTRVRADFYPYQAGETTLTAFLPGWVFEGSWEAAENRLASVADRARIRAEVASGIGGWTVAPDHLTWADVVVSAVATDQHTGYLGRTIATIALAERRDALEVVMDLLRAERGAVSVLIFGAGAADVETIGNDPAVLVGSDGIGNSLTEGPLFGPIHPRNYGTFPRFLSQHPGPELSLAVRRLTALPCEHFRILLRGSIAAGFVADLVTWSPDAREGGPSYGEGPRYSKLFDSVWVRGTPAVWNGEITGLRAGRVLRRPGPAAP